MRWEPGCLAKQATGQTPALHSDNGLVDNGLDACRAALPTKATPAASRKEETNYSSSSLASSASLSWRIAAAASAWAVTGMVSLRSLYLLVR